MREDKFEAVFHYDWYDGPIVGVSNRDGKPYFFEYQGYKDNESEYYFLTPIEDDVLPLVIESWQIWRRWEVAFHKGETSMENHPYLPADKQRGEEISKILDEVLKIDESNFIELDAEFKVNENQVPGLGHTEFLVKWIEK